MNGFRAITDIKLKDVQINHFDQVCFVGGAVNIKFKHVIQNQIAVERLNFQQYKLNSG